MSKIEDYRIQLQESADYQFGWDSAERGKPRPEWPDPKPSIFSQEAQRLGWDDYRQQDNDHAHP